MSSILFPLIVLFVMSMYFNDSQRAVVIVNTTDTSVSVTLTPENSTTPVATFSSDETTVFIVNNSTLEFNTSAAVSKLFTTTSSTLNTTLTGNYSTPSLRNNTGTLSVATETGINVTVKSATPVANFTFDLPIVSFTVGSTTIKFVADNTSTPTTINSRTYSPTEGLAKQSTTFISGNISTVGSYVTSHAPTNTTATVTTSRPKTTTKKSICILGICL